MPNKVLNLLLLIIFNIFVTTHITSQNHLEKDSVATDSVAKKSKVAYDKLLKEGRKKTGLFNVYVLKGDYYFEIEENLFEKDFLIINKISKVPYELNGHGINKGMAFETKIIRFYNDTVTNKIWVKAINPKIKSPKNSQITLSIKDNYIGSIIEEFDVESTNKDSTSIVIKVNKIFDGSRTSFSDLLSNIGLGGFGGVKTKLSKIEAIKTFPKNIVAKSLLTTSVKEGAGPALPLSIGVTTNIVLLPEDVMKPRFSDNRIGYFTTPMTYYNDNQHEVEKRNLITRWRLEPKENEIEKYLKGELVEPKKQIIYYIDPATPKQWVPYIKSGVLDWNIAFEKAGFKNVLVVKEVTEKDRDFDIDDVRYSVITYTASERQNAMGPSVVDPRSGEIIESDIIWWHNLMKGLHSWLRIQTGIIDENSRKNKFSDEHMGKAIRFVSSHEVGHTFGLKHNMGASYSYPVDSLRSATFTKRMGGTAPSIMDYARYNYVAQPGDNVEELNPKVGVYDTYAIEWGYRWLNSKKPHDEIETLNYWIRKHENDPLYFYGEQQRSVIDPRSQSEDLGNDAVKASEYGLLNLKRIIPNVLNWTYEKGKDYYKASKLYKEIIDQWDLYNYHVLANIGGMYINNTVYDDNKNTYMPVPFIKQKEALDYIIENAIKPQEWLFTPSYINKIFAVRDAPDGERYYSPVSMIRAYQAKIFYNLLSTERLTRIIENQALSNNMNVNEVFSQKYLFDQLHNAIFEKTIRGKSLTMLERLTQKNYVDILTVSRNELLKKTKENSIKASINFRNIHFSYIPRVSDIGSQKLGALTNVLRLIESKRKKGNQVTKDHYADLIARIKYNLNN